VRSSNSSCEVWQVEISVWWIVATCKHHWGGPPRSHSFFGLRRNCMGAQSTDNCRLNPEFRGKNQDVDDSNPILVGFFSQGCRTHGKCREQTVGTCECFPDAVFCARCLFPGASRRNLWTNLGCASLVVLAMIGYDWLWCVIVDFLNLRHVHPLVN